MKYISLLLLLSAFSFSGISQNEFAFEMYSEMDTKGNMLFSPTSIKTAFAMAFEGANSETQREFEKVFGFKEDNTAFLEEIEQLKSAAEISNSIWILENYKILDRYTDKMKSSFDSEPFSADFKNNPEESAKRINDWIEKSTNGMIKKMLTPGDVDGIKMALVNAIYFKQSWKYTFKSKRTKKTEFTNSDASKTDVEMMHSERRYRAYQGQNEQIVELPYSDNKTSMMIILPNKMDGYEMTNAVYTGLSEQLSHREVNLDLPKFTFETPTFELKPILKKMGLISAFENYADFTGMRKENDLKIGSALHKAKIIVNEKGTEAAAATVVTMKAKTTSVSSSPRPPVLKITVDKPFYYFITDNETGAILFMGKMNSLK